MCLQPPAAQFEGHAATLGEKIAHRITETRQRVEPGPHVMAAAVRRLRGDARRQESHLLGRGVMDDTIGPLTEGREARP